MCSRAHLGSVVHTAPAALHVGRAPPAHTGAACTVLPTVPAARLGAALLPPPPVVAPASNFVPSAPCHAGRTGGLIDSVSMPQHSGLPLQKVAGT